MTTQQQQTRGVDGDEFELRGVKEHELSEWGALCGKAFAHRSGRPERFLEKYLADPTRSLDTLRVAVSSDGRLASTVRVFQRSIRMGKEIVPMAGIGEVCTDPAYRGKGLAKKVMNDALAYLDRYPGAWISALDSAEGLEKYYGSFGYHSVPLHYAVLNITAGEIGPARSLVPEKPTVVSSAATGFSSNVQKTNRRLAYLWRSVMSGSEPHAAAACSSSSHQQTTPVYEVHLKDSDGTTNLIIKKIDIDEHVFELDTIYDSYSDGLYGTIMRSHAYWRELVPYKLGENGIWAAFIENESGNSLSMIAYIAVTEKRGTIKIAEYGCRKHFEANNSLFETLARIGLNNIQGIQRLRIENERNSFSLECPRPVLSRLGNLDLPIEKEKTVHSWMYRLHPEVGTAKVSRKAVHPRDYLIELKASADQDKHLVWFTDGF